MLSRTAVLRNVLFIKNGSRAICALSVSAPSQDCKCSTKSGFNSVTKVDRPLCVKNSSHPSFYFVKTYCSTAAKEEDPNIATYEEVKNINSHPEKLLIDVREPEELKETGQIPFSINIPLGDVATALSFETPANKFKEKFGRAKPSNNTPIVFYCKIGKRSQTATDAAKQLGFQKHQLETNIAVAYFFAVSDLRRAFTLPGEYFIAQYGREKPGLSAQLIFSCKTGRRAQQALDAVSLLGYKNVKNYKGSWLDWAEREGLSK